MENKEIEIRKSKYKIVFNYWWKQEQYFFETKNIQETKNKINNEKFIEVNWISLATFYILKHWPSDNFQINDVFQEVMEELKEKSWWKSLDYTQEQRAINMAKLKKTNELHFYHWKSFKKWKRFNSFLNYCKDENWIALKENELNSYVDYNPQNQWKTDKEKENFMIEKEILERI